MAIIEATGLTKRYGATIALDGLSFEVEEGRIFGFVGANGAGKTTAMRIVLGVLEADAGEGVTRRPSSARPPTSVQRRCRKR